MTRAGRLISYVAFGLMAAFAAVGSLFVAGYAFEDPGGWEALGLVALWIVPMLALTLVALRWPATAVWVLGVGLVLIVGLWAWDALDTQTWREFMDEVGPVLAIATFILGLPVATLGLRRPATAGLMLVALAVVPYLAFVYSVSDEPWRGIGNSLTTSSTIATVPTLAIGLLFLLAAVIGRLGRPAAPVEPVQPQPPMASASGGRGRS